MNSKVLLKVIDAFKGEDVLGRYLFFLETLKWDRDQVLEYQTLRFNQLIKHARENVPYYKERLSSIKDLSDLKRIGILQRENILANESGLIDKRRSKKELIAGSSSGTSGIPIKYYNDKFGVSSGKASSYVLEKMIGREFGKRSVHIWGNQSSMQQWKTLNSRLKNKLINQKKIASTSINDPNELEGIAREIMAFKPVSIDGYSSSIFTLAKYFEEKGYKINSLKNIVTTAENLEEYQQEVIERVFCPVSDLYGSGEVLSIALRPANDKKYYVFDPHVIIETQDSEIAGMKEIVVTDLDNYAMPLIRYKIGDLIDNVFTPVPGSKYPFNWFNKINGRSSDIIGLPNGKKIHPVNIFGGTLFRKYKGIRRHKVIWDGKRFEFVFEADQTLNTEGLKNEIKNLVAPFDVDFMVTVTEKIMPSENGKYRYMEIKNANK